MTLSQKGAYMDLLCLQWSQGDLHQDDIDFVCKSLTAEDKARVLRKFKQSGINCFQNERLESERQKQIEYREQQSAKGRKGMARRWDKSGNNTAITSVITQGITGDNSPSPSPSPSPIIHTHTSDANLPTWHEVKQLAEMRGVPESSAKTFFDHHEGNQLWFNQHGKLINWQHKLTTWAANDRQTPPKTNAINRPTNPNRNAGTYNDRPLSPGVLAKVR